MPTCPHCNGEGWREPIGPCADGSYITSRPCKTCDQTGEVSQAYLDVRRKTAEYLTNVRSKTL